jgi:hypothetical protein
VGAGGDPAPMMMLVRLWHHYIGFLIAPSVLFFALTGSMQLFSLHEAHGDYHAPVLIEALGNVHKDQVFRTRPPRGAPEPAHHHDDADADAAGHDHHDDDAPADAASPPAAVVAAPANTIRPASAEAAQPSHVAAPPPKLGTTLLKGWFLAVALGLVTSICLGLWIGFMHVRRRWVALALLAAGAVVPVLLLLV